MRTERTCNVKMMHRFRTYSTSRKTYCLAFYELLIYEWMWTPISLHCSSLREHCSNCIVGLVYIKVWGVYSNYFFTGTCSLGFRNPNNTPTLPPHTCTNPLIWVAYPHTWYARSLHPPLPAKKVDYHLSIYLDFAELVAFLVDADHDLVYDTCFTTLHEGTAITLGKTTTCTLQLDAKKYTEFF